MKKINVDKNNYKQYRYISDYRNGVLDSITDEELKAQLYHIKDIYKGMTGMYKALAQLAARSIKTVMMERGIK